MCFLQEQQHIRKRTKLSLRLVNVWLVACATILNTTEAQETVFGKLNQQQYTYKLNITPKF